MPREEKKQAKAEVLEAAKAAEQPILSQIPYDVEDESLKFGVAAPEPEAETEEVAEEIAAEYKSEGFEIGFNANYLKDILGQIDSDTVELHLADAGAPTLIRRDENSPALYVLMPMRV